MEAVTTRAGRTSLQEFNAKTTGTIHKILNNRIK
jgi:hypothetical protein